MVTRQPRATGAHSCPLEAVFKTPASAKAHDSGGCAPPLLAGEASGGTSGPWGSKDRVIESGGGGGRGGRSKPILFLSTEPHFYFLSASFQTKHQAYLLLSHQVVSNSPRPHGLQQARLSVLSFTVSRLTTG